MRFQVTVLVTGNDVAYKVARDYTGITTSHTLKSLAKDQDIADEIGDWLRNCRVKVALLGDERVIQSILALWKKSRYSKHNVRIYIQRIKAGV
ncbi:MAG: hypothetical protein M1150_00605 [Patescibacteria group bacterium]|nr:hypothetical protein [Patescibacteria group bacterium]